MAESHKKLKQADKEEAIKKEVKKEDSGKEDSGKKDSKREDPSKNMPTYDKNEKWVQDHIKKFGEDPGFF